MVSEEQLINLLKTAFPDYIGDDAAVISYQEDQKYVITKDLLVEDVHFRTSYFGTADLAYKALHVNLSDIAAMGAHPLFVLMGMAVPVTYQKYIGEFLQNFIKLCKDHAIVLIGGDTTKSLDKLLLSITAIGAAKRDHIKYCHTAKPGDLICYVGDLGYAHLGLTMFESNYNGVEIFKKACLRPIARIQEGSWLGTQSSVHAMMDVSDGLFVNLKKLCKASSCGAAICLDGLLPTDLFLAECKNLNLDPIHTMLIGGEDYGLLFTIKASNYQEVANQFRTIFNYSFACIGKIKKGNALSFMEGGFKKEWPIKEEFSHFGAY